MNRREFLQCAALISANATLLPTGWALTGEQKTYLAAQTNYINQTAIFFNATQRAAITAVVDHIIPATETAGRSIPGAVSAGVPQFIELMLQDWFNTEEKNHFMAGFNQLQNQANGNFAKLTPAQQLQLLEQLEQQAENTSWYDIGNVLRIWDDTAPFICQIKELTVLGFFLSEVGATQALRRNPMGAFNGDIPLAETDTAYAVDLPIRAGIEE